MPPTNFVELDMEMKAQLIQIIQTQINKLLNTIEESETEDKN